MKAVEELRLQALEALERTWFIQSIDVIDRTDQTISLRLVIRSDLFVQAHLGEISQSLYFALIEKNQRNFWHRPGIR